MTGPIRILYIDDNVHDRELVRDALEREHDRFQVTAVRSRAEFEVQLTAGNFDLVLSDFNILGFTGLQVLDAVRARHARLPVVIVTGTGSEEIGVEAMKRGAADYVIKTPRHIQRLPQSILTVLEKLQLQEERERIDVQLRESEALFHTLARGSPVGIFLVRNHRARSSRRARPRLDAGRPSRRAGKHHRAVVAQHRRRRSFPGRIPLPAPRRRDHLGAGPRLARTE